MQKIFKYSIKNVEEQELVLPKDYEILSVQVINNLPYIYALVNPHPVQEKVRVTIRIYGTGEPITHERLKYIGTYHIFLGDFVFHIFKEL